MLPTTVPPEVPAAPTVPMIATILPEAVRIVATAPAESSAAAPALTPARRRQRRRGYHRPWLCAHPARNRRTLRRPEQRTCLHLRDDPRAGCRTLVVCDTETLLWTVADTPPCPRISDSCGASSSEAPECSSASAESAPVTCTYPAKGNYCVCENGEDWRCQGPPPEPCPVLLPNQGSVCDNAELTECDYGNCASRMVQASCVYDVWSWAALCD